MGPRLPCVHSKLSQVPQGEGGSASCPEGDPMGRLSDHSSAGQSPARAEGVIWVTVLTALRITGEFCFTTARLSRVAANRNPNLGRCGRRNYTFNAPPRPGSSAVQRMWIPSRLQTSMGLVAWVSLAM